MRAARARLRAGRRAAGLLLALAAFAGSAGGAVADEVRYSLGSVQAEDSLSVDAGESLITELYFYNVDGNLPAQVALKVVEAPDGWGVALSRPGIAAAEAESVTLAVAPSSPHPASPECVAEQAVVLLPSLGYVIADTVAIHVTAPDVESASEGVLRIHAVAAWQGPGGVAPFPQERLFTYRVTSSGSSAAVPAAAAPEASGPVVAPLLLAACLGAGALVLVIRAVAQSGQVA